MSPKTSSNDMVLSEYPVPEAGPRGLPVQSNDRLRGQSIKFKPNGQVGTASRRRPGRLQAEPLGCVGDDGGCAHRAGARRPSVTAGLAGTCPGHLEPVSCSPRTTTLQVDTPFFFSWGQRLAPPQEYSYLPRGWSHAGGMVCLGL